MPGHECVLNAREEGRRAAGALLERDPRLTALLVQTDQMAPGALDHVRARGLPISVIGFDDIPAAAAADLTTVRQPLLEKRLAAGRLLVDPDGPREVLLDLELVPRGSTVPPPG